MKARSKVRFSLPRRLKKSSSFSTTALQSLSIFAGQVPIGNTKDRQTVSRNRDVMAVKEMSDILTQRGVVEVCKGELGRVEAQPLPCIKELNTSGESYDLIRRSTGVEIVDEATTVELGASTIAS